MNTRLFNKITQTLKQQFSEASHEFLMEQARQMYEIEMQQRSKLSPSEKAKAEAEDIIDLSW